MSVVAIIDYDVGNIKSIVNALEKVGAEVIITKNEKEIMAADGVVLPGVGAFSHGMMKLHEYGLVDVIKNFSKTDKPLLGICLGMQMLFSSSNEFGITFGLDLIHGKIEKLKTLNPEYLKLPHVSWSEIFEPKLDYWKNSILDNISSQENMYFVHSFAAFPENKENILSTTVYSDYEFCSSVQEGNIYGCQFHPEKSASEGLKIMSNFVNICERNKNV